MPATAFSAEAGTLLYEYVAPGEPVLQQVSTYGPFLQKVIQAQAAIFEGTERYN